MESAEKKPKPKRKKKAEFAKKKNVAIGPDQPAVSFGGCDRFWNWKPVERCASVGPPGGENGTGVQFLSLPSFLNY